MPQPFLVRIATTPPNPMMIALADHSLRRGWPFVRIDDSPSPTIFALNRLHFGHRGYRLESRLRGEATEAFYRHPLTLSVWSR